MQRRMGLQQAIQLFATDGTPLAETGLHGQVMTDTRDTLADVFYEEGNPRKHLPPDVFVAKGVSNADARQLQADAELARWRAELEALRRPADFDSPTRSM